MTVSFKDAESRGSPSRRYRVEKTLHSTQYASVLLAEEEDSKRQVVIKRGKKTKQGSSSDEATNEAIIFRKLGLHENIVHVFDLAEDKQNVEIVMERVHQDLFSHVSASHGVTEAKARHLFRQLVRALQHLHHKDIAHLDLSLENILVDSELDILKLCDFGSAVEAKRGGARVLNLVARRLNYAAPELVEGQPVDVFQADVYSLGALLFMMLFGHPAYDIEGGKKNGKMAMRYATAGSAMLKKLLSAYGHYTRGNPKTPSDTVVDLLARMLTLDPAKRIQLDDIPKHPWLDSNN
eukprot:CAMPEP_0167772090 /NCGR_PEP_ID=MMETSP0111_2-20121227/649_1 /TAXON_ID=91324 /ORGANISM="Lotharella globosa, Strain CCCM811" /LENGTH=293 /DNA_ID=CAMNT_0007661533 /DNA_START=119 /DNA_END=1000 /DNA_ORIENTATION=+